MGRAAPIENSVGFPIEGGDKAAGFPIQGGDKTAGPQAALHAAEMAVGRGL
jgi:hypothetical protein